MKKLAELQLKLKAPKNQFNKFGEYRYRSCEDIVEAVKPIAAELGLFLTLSDDIVLVGDRYYIKATAIITDTESGNSVQTTAFAREAAEKKKMDDSQITGTASSYARKYALNGLLMIDDTKDADTDEYSNQQYTEKGKGKIKEAEAVAKERKAVGNTLGQNAFTTEEPQQEATIDKIKERTLLALINQKGANLGEILKFYNLINLSNMTVPQFMQVVATLEKRPDKGETKDGIQKPAQ